jgi:uncharacterized protein (DUF2062 family)
MINLSVRVFWNRIKKVLSDELRANTSPLRASLSIGMGVLVGLSPLYGVHTLIVLALAFMFRLNRPLALLASGITLLPFVPIWIAGGIFIGKLVAPVETTSRIIDHLNDLMTFDQFWKMVSGVARFCKRFIPSDVFKSVDEEASHGVVDGFVQWLIGCSVFAVIGSIIAFVLCYYILTRRVRARRKVTNIGTTNL